MNIIEQTTGEKIETFQHNSECDVIEQVIEKYKNHHSISLITEKLKVDENADTFQIPPCLETDIYNIIPKLSIKSAQGLDKIPEKILKMCAHLIADPL